MPSEKLKPAELNLETNNLVTNSLASIAVSITVCTLAVGGRRCNLCFTHWRRQ